MVCLFSLLHGPLLVFKSACVPTVKCSFISVDYFPVPANHHHLAVLELSNRHTVPQLQATYDALSKETSQAMINIPSSLPNGSKIILVRPFICFDEKGVAVTFVPDATSDSQIDNEHGPEGDETRKAEPFTYQHMRSEMQKLALKMNIKIDTCYSAATAHVTLGRFIGNSMFASSFSVDNTHITTGDATQTPTRRLVSLLVDMNRELEESYWGENGLK
jgi:hypothetical protein